MSVEGQVPQPNVFEWHHLIELHQTVQPSWADSCIRWIIKFNFLETNSIVRVMWKDSALNFCFHISLMMEMELVSKMLDFIIHLTWLAAWEGCIELYHLPVTCDIFIECFTFLYWTLFFLESLNGNLFFPIVTHTLEYFCWYHYVKILLCAVMIQWKCIVITSV